VRLAADRIGINKYQIGAQANLLFTQWKATGETLSRFKEHTWYEFGYGGPTFGENLDKAFHNENWAQHPGYKQLAGPAGGDNGEAAAYSVWQLSALPGTGISSFTVATSVQNEHAKDYDGHSYVQWSQSPVGPWTTIYSHSWDASWSTTANFGTVKLDSPLAKVYVRIAADKFAWNHYYVDKNGANLRFDKLKITGQLLPLPAEQEKALLQQAQQYLSEARKQGVPKAQYTYQGKNYRLELGEQLTITSLTPGGPREILKNVKIDVFQSGWKGAFNQGRLLFYDVLEENDGDIVLDTTWKPGGPLREQTTVKILFHLHPYYFQADFDVLYTGEDIKWGERGLRLQVGKDRIESFSGSDAGLHIAFTPKEDHLWWNGSIAVYVMPWKKYEQGQGAKFSMFVQPYVAGEPESIPAPAHLTGDPKAGLLGVSLTPTEQRNVFVGDQKPFVTLTVQNHARQEQVLSWTLEASDFFNEKHFTQSGQLSVPGEGTIRQQKIQLPAWKGHINVKLAARTGEERVEQTSQLAVIPDPERHYKAQSPFGLMFWGTNELSLDLANWLGAHWIRYFNPAKEDLSSYTSRGLEPIPGANDLFKAPAGTFRFTEMANEPNFGTLGAAYAEKLKISSIKQRQHDPKIAVGLPGTAGVDIAWIRELAENGCWDYLDLITVHLHCFPYAPEVDNTLTRYYWLASAVKKLFPIMEEYGYKPVIDSEQGYLGLDPNVRVEGYGLGQVSKDNTTAAFLVRSYLEAMAYGLLGKHWFTLNQYGGFGLFYYNTPRPGYSAYAVMSKMLDGAQYWGENVDLAAYAGKEKTGGPLITWFGQATYGMEKEFEGTDSGDLALEEDQGLAPRLYQRVFKMPDGEPLLVAWATLRRTDVITEPVDTPAWRNVKPSKSYAWDGTELTEEPEPLDVTIDVGVPQVTIVDLMGNKRAVDCPDGKLQLAVDDYPQYIFGASRKILDVAAKYRYPRFPQEATLSHGSEVVQALLPPAGEYPRRKNVYDQENIAANLVVGQTAEFTVRITNLSKEPVKGEISLELPAGWKSEPEKISFEAPQGEQIISAPIKVTPAQTGRQKMRSVVTIAGERISDSVINVKVAAK
jgi:hypothetical protein